MFFYDQEGKILKLFSWARIFPHPYILGNIEHNVTWELKNERAEPYNRLFTTFFPPIKEIFGS